MDRSVYPFGPNSLSIAQLLIGICEEFRDAARTAGPASDFICSAPVHKHGWPSWFTILSPVKCRPVYPFISLSTREQEQTVLWNSIVWPWHDCGTFILCRTVQVLLTVDFLIYHIFTVLEVTTLGRMKYKTSNCIYISSQGQRRRIFDVRWCILNWTIDLNPDKDASSASVVEQPCLCKDITHCHVNR